MADEPTREEASPTAEGYEAPGVTSIGAVDSVTSVADNISTIDAQ